MSYNPEQQGGDAWNAPQQPPPDPYPADPSAHYSIQPDPYQTPPVDPYQPGVQPYSAPPGSVQPYGTPPPGYPQSHPGAYAGSGPPQYGYQPHYGGPPAPAQWSDKTKVAAGLLQLLPAIFFGLGGIGRLYAGQIGFGITQIGVTLLGWTAFWCGFLLILPWFLQAAIWLWFVIDGIIVLAGSPRDGEGRLLR